MVTRDDEVRERVLRRVMTAIAEMDFRRPPPLMGAEIHRIIRQETQNPDPYGPVKKHLTDFCLKLLPDLAARVAAADDPFEAAVRMAVAGNIIDFSVTPDVGTDHILATIDETMSKPFARSDIPKLQKEAARASTILYLADNAGEIVFDRLLLERLPREKVTFVVRGAPTINDATRADAERSGIPDLVTVTDNGTDIPGTYVKGSPDGFREMFRQADVVISKGQGNYETLSLEDRKIFFLFRAKCPTIALDLGCALGDTHAFASGGKG
jgi:uncharacterized protein with ATP-grasp and redox domains